VAGKIVFMLAGAAGESSGSC